MRYFTLIFAAVALSLFGLTAAQGTGTEDCFVYTNLDEYLNDVPECPVGCWEWLITYHQVNSNCGDTPNLECLCTTPEPDATNSTVLGLYVGSFECMKNRCPETQNTRFSVAVSRFANTCAQMRANGTISATASVTGDGVATGTVYAPTGTGTETAAATVFTDTTSGYTNVSSTPTDTAVIAQQTVNAAGRSSISNWEMTLGLPLVAGLVVVQFL